MGYYDDDGFSRCDCGAPASLCDCESDDSDHNPNNDDCDCLDCREEEMARADELWFLDHDGKG